MLAELAANRATLNTAASPACLWLLPGGHAGQPLTLARSSNSSARPEPRPLRPAPRRSASSSCRPAPVVARALGYSAGTATCHVIAAHGTWHRYPASHAGS